MLNQITLIGRLGKPPEMRYSQDGKAITKFSMATDDGYGDRKETTWHNVVVFDKSAEACAQYLDKGSLVAVVGRQTHRKYEKDGDTRYFSEVVANRVQFLDTRSAHAGDPDGLPARQVEDDIDPDELPFHHDQSTDGWERDHGEAFR